MARQEVTVLGKRGVVSRGATRIFALGEERLRRDDAVPAQVAQERSENSRGVFSV
jgi:hypothetical protein